MLFQFVRTVVFIFFFTVLLSGQSPKVEAPIPNFSATDDFVLKASTRLVVVNVTVRDKQGRPVTGLSANDFTVNENGKPQKVASLAYFDSQSPGPAPPPFPAYV